MNRRLWPTFCRKNGNKLSGIMRSQRESLVPAVSLSRFAPFHGYLHEHDFCSLVGFCTLKTDQTNTENWICQPLGCAGALNGRHFYKSTKRAAKIPCTVSQNIDPLPVCALVFEMPAKTVRMSCSAMRTIRLSLPEALWGTGQAAPAPS
jgi:hypothetical protein